MEENTIYLSDMNLSDSEEMLFAAFGYKSSTITFEDFYDSLNYFTLRRKKYEWLNAKLKKEVFMNFLKWEIEGKLFTFTVELMPYLIELDNYCQIFSNKIILNIVDYSFLVNCKSIQFFKLFHDFIIDKFGRELIGLVSENIVARENLHVKKYFLVAENGNSNPKFIHYGLKSAEIEAGRLSKQLSCNVYICEIVKTTLHQ